ncbi:MAG TPA: DoxX family protein [Rhizomicrobium sp.]
MSFSELISPLVGRIVLAGFFLSAALRYAGQWQATILLMGLKGVPAPTLLLAIGIVVMLVGGLSVVLGFHARYGALLLFAFTLIASVLMHDYWRIGDAVTRAADYEIFSRNIAIAGALLIMVGMGAGPFSLDNRLNAPKKKK